MARRSPVPLTEDDDATVPSTNISTGTSTCWRVLHFCNTFAVAILAICVVFLFIQLQYVNYQLVQEQTELDALQVQLKNQTQGQIQELSDQVQQEHSYTLYQMAGTFTLLTCLITMFHMSSHLKNFNEPAVQRKIITILWFSPIYAVTSFLSLLWPVADGYLAVIKDFYEAYVVYTFLSFLIAVLGKGDRNAVVEILSRHADHLDKPTRCLRRYYHPPPETGNIAKANAVLTECLILTMQFVFIRPITSIAHFVVDALAQGQDDGQEASQWAYFYSPNFFIAMIINVSVFFAFRGLLKFYHAVHDDLAWCQPFSKFLAIKGIVFLTFWQGLLISIIVNLHGGGSDSNGTGKSPQQKGAEIQNVLICCEMLFFSIAHWCTFPAEEWAPGYKPKQYEKPGLGFKDFASDMSYIASSSSNARSYRRAQSEAAASNRLGSSISSGDEEAPGGDVFPDELAPAGDGVYKDDEPYEDRLQ